MRGFTFLVLLSVICLSGCATQLDGDAYRQLEPQFDLFTFFDGDVTAWGIVQNRQGELVQRFRVDIQGSVEDDVLTLDERFFYSVGDGVKSRVWVIEKTEDGRYRGSAGDILDVAEGDNFGNAFQWQYSMDLPLDDGPVRVRFNDWIWAFDRHRIINRSYIQKFGLDVGEVTIFMEKAAARLNAAGEL
jgi:hypothetical protein